jgi:HEPN domain-containing protein
MHVGGQYNKVEVIKNVFLSEGADEAELQSWKEKLASVVKHLPSDDDKLKPVIQFLVTAINPAKIYKLEHKKTEPINGSYTDLLIVISGKNNRPFTELEPILEIPYIRQETVCCSLHNEGNLLEALEAGHIFYSMHCIPENLVYDDGKLTYPVTSPEALAEIKQQVRSGFKQYIQKALDFTETAAYMLEIRPSDIAIFLLHQAAELTYRGILKYLNGYDKKTHEIRALKKYVRRCAPQLCNAFTDDTPEESRLLDLLENSYLKSRYEQEYPASEKDLSTLFDKVKDLQEAAVHIVSRETE